ncbi:MAG: phosphoribosylanthranilate isomerase [Pseudomonadota bacterium]
MNDQPAFETAGRTRPPGAGIVRVKVCGLTTPHEVSVAAEAGAAYVGLVFFPPSPRALSPGAARDAALAAPAGVVKVGLFVDPDDATLDTVLGQVALDMVQLHGRETPQRVAAVRRHTGLPVIKAVGIRERADLDRTAAYAGAADQLLIDAKPPAGAALPGGNGLAFDWSLLAGHRFSLPWMLAGGLTPQNAAQAVARTGARQLDVSSGVEASPGVKDPERIRAFIDAVA